MTVRPNTPGDNELLFLPLGGAGEIGMNLNLYGHAGKWLMVDLGIAFTDDTTPGIEVVMQKQADIKTGKILYRLDTLFGVVNKQPEMTGWREGLSPWTPVREGDRLYGRGGADDGYAVYASIAAVQALKAQKVAHPRIVGLIETCEESGSYDLLPYIDALRTRLGDVALVICLDSGAGNYDQLWLTTSLRGMASGTLKVEILTEGVHSGDASGLVPSSFRIVRQLLDRLEDSKTGRLLPETFHCEVPAERLAQAKATAAPSNSLARRLV